jgi:hypothetical protein
MPPPSPPSDSIEATPTVHTAHASLIEALAWYDRAASGNRREYQALRLLAIVLAAAIPVLTTSRAPSYLTAIFGSAIVVTEGVLQLFGFHDRYIGFRSAWNALDRERRLYESSAGRYADNSNPERTLAERIDELLGQETARWASDTTGASPGHRNPPEH